MAPKNRVVVTCDTCGKVFEKTPSALRKTNFCCKACAGIHWGRTYGPLAPQRRENRRIERTCLICGKQFTIIRSWLKNGGGKYCSRACQHEAKRRVTGENHPLYTQVTCVCQWCGKEYLSKKVLVPRSKFCSLQCHGAYRASHNPKKRTGIEIAVETMLKDIGADFVTQKPMGRFLCDFYVPTAKLAIECDGVYWHNIPKIKKRDKRKDKWLTANGYRILRLKEMDIDRNPDWCKLQILIALAA